jgi:2-oxoglutarate dehydrogenase E1 component
MASTFATRFNLEVIEQNYDRWRKDPASVDASWGVFFEGFELGSTRQNGAAAPAATAGKDRDGVPLQTKVDGLVYHYRYLGHTIAHLDPLSKTRPQNPLLSLEELGFTESDLDLVVSSKYLLDGKPMKLRDMISQLVATYCGTIGAEFMHIGNPRVRNWLRERIEGRITDYSVPPGTQRRMLRQVLSVESFEHFLHTRYVGQKRFSIEGGESLIVALYGLLEKCPQGQVDELCIGMAHRGRLSVINEFLGKSLTVMFAEFSENFIPNTVGGDGDVKYHLGYVSEREIDGHKIDLRLSANPSHLEAVDPVVEGMTRARQRVRNDSDARAKVIPVLIHGDAAFAGQGIVAECLNMSQLPGYRTGGTVHIIVDNQIGFTTLPEDARSSRYCSDVAKMVEAPVLHVNGDDPLAVRFCAELAFDFRQTFKSDVVIDIYCYRRHGHNETDEPLYTQPLLYAEIGGHPSVGDIFKRRLIESKCLTAEEALELSREASARYEKAFAEVKAAEEKKNLGTFAEANAEFQPPYSHAPVDTAISPEFLQQLCHGLTTVPESFRVVPRLRKFFLEKRMAAAANGGPFDWSYAEALAFGSLLVEKVPIRLSGQDSRRGTFSQRHAVLYDEKTRERYIPLMHLAPDQERICIYNSLLSEAAVLGFDYGYSLNYPEMLTLWEAQFGDFSNGAQVIIDQFIASAESKWQRPSGIVLLLPHGYEGQGPEHSSGRLERFLQLCAEDNMQVCNLTTPAQYFHLLRRQMKRPFRKPLVLMTPKSLLRAADCVSMADDFTKGRFQEVLPATFTGDAAAVQRLIFCSGKVYFDLVKYQQENQRTDAAIIRIEQLHPLHEDAIREQVARFPKATTYLWCQEESQNMGAWSYIVLPLRRIMGEKLIRYAGRNASASPAVGSLGVHKIEQKQVVHDAFA